MPNAALLSGAWSVGTSALAWQPDGTWTNRAKAGDGSLLTWVSKGGPDPRMLQCPGQPNPSDYTDLVVVRDR